MSVKKVISDLTDDERQALIELLHGAIDRDRFPLSPRIGIRSNAGRAEPVTQAEITARRSAGEESAAMSSSARSHWERSPAGCPCWRLPVPAVSGAAREAP